MDLKKINKSVLLKKTRDYSFMIMFFLVFSIFIFFAIRPSLTTAFSLRKEEDELKKIDSLYERKIVDIVAIQSQLEESRDDIYLLNQAVTNYPELNQILKDIIDTKSFHINKANIGEVNLAKADDKSLQKLKIFLEGVGSFEDVQNFTRELHNQRRLKTIQRMVIHKNQESTESGKLKINMEIEAYYL